MYASLRPGPHILSTLYFMDDRTEKRGRHNYALHGWPGAHTTAEFGDAQMIKTYRNPKSPNFSAPEPAVLEF